jgi:hypothetical protein
MSESWPRVFDGMESFLAYAADHPGAASGVSPGGVCTRLGICRQHVSKLVHSGQLHAYIVYAQFADRVLSRPSAILIRGDSIDAYAVKPKNKGGRPRARIAA